MKALNKAIENAQIDYVFKQLAASGLPHAVAVSITAGMIWWDIKGWAIVLWFVALQTSHVMRIFILDSIWKKNAELGDYRVVKPFLVAGMVATGIVWSLVPGFFMEGVSTETFIFISIVIAGMVAATLPALAAYLPAYIAFVTPLLLVLTYRYYSLGMEANALLTLSYMAAVGVISVTINRLITNSITMDFEQRELLQEVTEAKEKAEEANVAKSRFLAAASHDLRQPLQALGLILESIKLRTEARDEIQTLVNQGLSSHDALTELFNALLELSRLEANQLEVHRVHFDLNQMLVSIINEFQPVAEEKSLSLTLSGERCIVDTDPVLFGRIIRNLLTNALKFTDKGSVTVAIERVDKIVSIRVVDTGIGIPKEEQARVFDEYHQVSNKARRREEGIGLGLSVVKKMSALLNHPIELESVPGSGSTFTLSLPLGDKQLVPEPPQATDISVSELNVLVIDDDASVLEAVNHLLQDWKCNVRTAVSIQAALELLVEEGFTPEFVLSDYRLEEAGTGVDAIEAVRSHLGEDIPALLMSGDTDPELVGAIRAQHFHLLRKPIKPVHLRKAIKQLVD
ncbi:MAG: ATP-binding protein [Pseudomonadales bacterium]|nr:ATP-binding protein [Pseudomonadales bacterium]